MSVASELAQKIIDTAEGNVPKSEFEGNVTLSYDVDYDANEFTSTIVLPIAGTSWNTSTSKLETDIADSLEAKPAPAPTP